MNSNCSIILPISVDVNRQMMDYYQNCIKLYYDGRKIDTLNGMYGIVQNASMVIPELTYILPSNITFTSNNVEDLKQEIMSIYKKYGVEEIILKSNQKHYQSDYNSWQKLLRNNIIVNILMLLAIIYFTCIIIYELYYRYPKEIIVKKIHGFSKYKRYKKLIKEQFFIVIMFLFLSYAITESILVILINFFLLFILITVSIIFIYQLESKKFLEFLKNNK
jgi:hypothetical protein